MSTFVSVELPSMYKPGYVPFQPQFKKREVTVPTELPRIPGLVDTPREKLYQGKSHYNHKKPKKLFAFVQDYATCCFLPAVVLHQLLEWRDIGNRNRNMF